MALMNENMFGNRNMFELCVADETQARRGVQHHYRLTPLPPRAGQAPLLEVSVALPYAVSGVTCVLLTPEARHIPLEPAAVHWDHLNWGYRQTWQGQLPAYPAGTVVRYTLHALPAAGGTPVAAEDAVFSYLVEPLPAPRWAQAAVVYQIFVDRFNPGAGRAWNSTTQLSEVYGGTLRGVIEKLDYLADLGINCIWLTPIFPDATPHGYHATDYFTVNPRLGTLAEVRELVQAAHARGIRLLLDFVANHVGRAHPAFQRASTAPTSDEYHWFTWYDWPEDYAAYFGIRELPKLNTLYPGAREYLLRSIRFWLEEIGFDGLRLDHADGPIPDFWTDVRALVQEIKPDAWIFGEIVRAAEVQRRYAGRLQGTLDFMLAQALRETFGFGTRSLSAFEAFLQLHEAYFPADFSRPSFLDNHDMDRFLWTAGNDTRRLKLAALCLYTLSGPPILYAGTELGVTQALGKDAPGSQGMEECRRPMPWEEGDAALLAYFRELLHFRRAHPVLWNGARVAIHVDDNTGTYAYLRHNDEETILVAFNLSSTPQTLTTHGHTLHLPPLAGAWLAL